MQSTCVVSQGKAGKFFVALQDWKDVQHVAEFPRNKTFFKVKGAALKKPVSRMDIYRHRTYGRFVLAPLITRRQQAETLYLCGLMKV